MVKAQTNSSAHVCTPGSEFIANLPAWDRVPRLATWINRVFEAEGSENSHRKAMIGLHLITDLTARAMPHKISANNRVIHGPGCPAPYVFCLVGSQGCGKSSALEHLTGLVTSQISFNELELGRPSALHTEWLVEITDVHHTAEWNTLKALTSCTHDQVRARYSHTPTIAARTAVIAVTSNQAPKQPFEHRRLYVVEITRQSVDIQWLKANRTQLFAEAKHWLLEAAA